MAQRAKVPHLASFEIYLFLYNTAAGVCQRYLDFSMLLNLS